MSGGRSRRGPARGSNLSARQISDLAGVVRLYVDMMYARGGSPENRERGRQRLEGARAALRALGAEAAVGELTRDYATRARELYERTGREDDPLLD